MASKLLRVTKGASKLVNTQPQVWAAASQTRHASALAEADQSEGSVPYNALDNQLKVVTESTDDPIATVCLRVNAGPVAEDPNTNGAANMLQKIFLKSCAEGGALKDIEKMGAKVGTDSSRVQSSFYIQCLQKDAQKAVGLLGKLVQEVKTDEASISAARPHVLQALEASRGDTVVLDLMHSAAFHSTPLGLPVQGNTRSINGLTSSMLSDYVSTLYKPANMVLSCVGGIAHDKTVETAQKAFTGASGERFLEPSIRQQGAEMKLRDDSMSASHIAISVQSPAYRDSGNVALGLAAAIMGQYDTSFMTDKRLDYMGDAAKSGLAHSFRPIHCQYEHSGLWGMYMQSNRENAEWILASVQGAWLELVSEFNPAVVERARRRVLSDLYYRMQNPVNVALQLSDQANYLSCGLSVAEQARRLKAQSNSDINAAVREYVYDHEPALGAYGNIEGIADYNRVRSDMFSMFR